tara:strand:+ start:533 stop:961 length:429 start_codon:yes stop_codon:yes gene_type:complete
MFGRKVKFRILLLTLSVISLLVILFLILKSLEENIVYFFSPTEINNKVNIELDKKIRIGGLVKENSVKKNDEFLIFIVTDLKNEIIVSYKGLVPNLFSEGKGVVAEGKLKDKKYFNASKILAKHDENYMPPEVKKALDQTNN